jgi:hypothetical protein
MVAKWYKIDPDIVYNWSCPRFFDRQEFMFVSDYRPTKPTKNKYGETPLGRGAVEYKGPVNG